MSLLNLSLISAFYVFAGVMHFVKPKIYLKMMPPYLPAHLTLVYLSGVAEILLGLLLWIPSARPLAAWGIIALLVAVFPANVYMLQRGGPAFKVPTWTLWVRLPLQGLLIVWAYYSGIA